MLSFRTLSVALAAVTFGGCAPVEEAGSPTQVEDLAAIREAGDQLVAALRSDDVPGIMAALTDDHFTMPPDQPTPPDNEALTAWHQARIDQFAFESEMTTEETRLYGDLAVQRWSVNNRLIPKGEGEVQTDSSKGVWIWERQEDGTWKLLWSIWNSNLSAEGGWR
jgi:ketosteroid isomerase-like protein